MPSKPPKIRGLFLVGEFNALNHREVVQRASLTCKL